MSTITNIRLVENIDTPYFPYARINSLCLKHKH